MIDTPHITETEERAAAVIRLTIPRTEIGQHMDAAIGELMGTLGAQGIRPVGALYSYHFRVDADVFDFELGIPVSSPVTPTGRVQSGMLPAAKVVRTIYHGPYEGLGEAWGTFKAWIESNALPVAPHLWEAYVRGPESGPDPATWETELNHVLQS